MTNEGLLQTIRSLLESIIPIIERPAIQRQIVAACIVLALAWLIPRLIDRLLRRTLFRPTPGAGGKVSLRNATSPRVRRALGQMYFPTLGLILGQTAIRIFASRGWLMGIMEQIQLFFLLLLVYRIIVAALHLVLNEQQATQYESRFLKPLFVLVILTGLDQLSSGIISISDQPLMTISERVVTIGSLFRSGVILYLFIVAGWLLRDTLTYLILPRLRVEAGMSNTILTMSQYVIVTAGIISALASLGIDLSTLAIIGAGLSVGIGFGLQELVANFVSGILLLFEQSIRPGDVIEISGNLGTVEKLRIRSTTIRTRDNIEIIVPNQNLLTSSVTTYTHTERLVRVNIPVSVSYNSDPAVVREVLTTAGKRHGLVRKRPEPLVFFEGFGDSNLDFELAVWIENAELGRAVRSDLRFIIWEELAKRKIEIAFPQRDLHIRSGVPWDAVIAQRAAVNGQTRAITSTEEHEAVANA